MKNMLDGTTRRFPSERALVLDILHFSRHVPTFGVERRFDLGEVARLRSNTERPISWSILFIKALGLASRDVPELRQFYLPYPWPRVHQSQHSVVSVSITRRIDNCERLFWGRFPVPEKTHILDLQSQLDRFRHEDPNVVFRRQMQHARLPAILRRTALWWRLYAAPAQRARRLGTVSISTLSSYGVLNRTHPNFLTASLDYGPLQDDGSMWVTLLCDHRILDGVVAARALNCIESMLVTLIQDELRGISSLARHAA